MRLIEGFGSERREIPIAPFDQEVRVTCVSCNTRWLNDIETEARPYLIPLMGGARHRLAPHGQRSVAVWIFKTLAMMEFRQPQRRVIPPVELHRFHASRALPPSGLDLRIGTFRGGEMAQDWLTARFNQGTLHPRAPVASRYRLDSFYTMFVLGQLVMFASYTAAPHGFLVKPAGQYARSQRQIWPGDGKTISWPLALRWSDDSLLDMYAAARTSAVEEARPLPR